MQRVLNRRGRVEGVIYEVKIRYELVLESTLGDKSCCRRPGRPAVQIAEAGWMAVVIGAGCCRMSALQGKPCGNQPDIRVSWWWIYGIGLQTLRELRKSAISHLT